MVGCCYLLVIMFPFITDHHHLKNYLRHKVAKHETEKKVKEKEDKQEDKPGESVNP